MVEAGDLLTVFGFTPAEFLRRVLGALAYIVLDLVVWLLIPLFIFQALRNIGQFPQPQITLLATPILVLSAISHVWTRNAIGYAAGAGGAITSTYFLFLVTNAGTLTIQAPIPTLPFPLTLTLSFPTLLYLLILPLGVTIAKNVWAAVHISSVQEVSLEETREL